MKTNLHRRAFIFCFFTALSFLNVSADELGQGKHSPARPDISRFIIDPNIKYQTIDNFSASDGWSMQYIGLWPRNKQQQMADWLFSTQNDLNGKPKGIGLSLWRFNIGAGSKEQGDASGIDNEWTRSECFLSPNGSYDWEKQQGQRNFLKLAKERGVTQFLGFILSAPVYWTQNGLATNTGRGSTFNLKEDKYNDFVRFMADVVQGLKRKDNIKLDYICPFNEPDGHWNWVGPKQEGTAATKNEIATTVKLLGNEFAYRHIKTKILVSESFDYNCMYKTHPYTKSDRGYLIQSFFSPDSSKTYIGKVPNVPHLMAAHSYWTNTPLSDLRKIRIEMENVLKKNNVSFWQTELCIMGNDSEIGGGGGFDKTMKTALYVARIIHHDLVYANASAWQWWRSVATSNYKDGLINAIPDESKLNGTFTDSKLMWTLGNYSRFIRPGAIRLGVLAYNNKNELIMEGDTDPYALMISAFKNINNKMVVVAINYHETEKNFSISLKGKSKIKWTSYLTNDSIGNDLTPKYNLVSTEQLTIPGRSVMTLVTD